MSWNELNLTLESNSIQCPIDGASYAKLRVYAELSASGSHDDFELEIADLRIEVLACPENTPERLIVTGPYCVWPKESIIISFLAETKPNPEFKSIKIDYNSLSKKDQHMIDLQIEREIEEIANLYNADISADIVAAGIDYAYDTWRDSLCGD